MNAVIVIMIIGIFWTLSFVTNLSNMIVRVSSATYYENFSPDTRAKAEICKAVIITYWNHFGTIAIGSLLIPLMGILKWTLLLAAQLLEKIFIGND